MAKGIAAFVVVLAIIMSISVLSGIGYYNELGVDYSDDQYNEEVQAAADAFTSQNSTTSGTSPIEDFTVGAGNTMQAAWQVISNTKGVLMLLFGIPETLAAMLETFARIVYGVTFAGFVRGVVLS